MSVKTAALSLALVASVAAAKPGDKAKPAQPKAGETQGNSLENYQDLIAKAQNLTLQRDRLQTSQVLIRGIQREPKGSVGYKELARALDELTSVFYTEKAQGLFSIGEAQVETRPREAIEQLQEALRAEDGNLSVLRTLARTYLRSGECAKAEGSVKAAEVINPYSAEVKLLRLQTLACQKSFEALTVALASSDTELDGLEKYLHGMRVQDALRRKDVKKARALLAGWEKELPDYPEVHFWKWEISRAAGALDRTAAVRYSRLCQNLTPRQRKSFNLDVELCKGKEGVDAYLKESGMQSLQTSPPGTAPSSPGADDED